MKKYFYPMVSMTMLFVSCKKEFKPQTFDEVVILMKGDSEMKELYSASKLWMKMTSIDISKRKFDSAATVAYLKDFRSHEHTRLMGLAENIKRRYSLNRYSNEQAKEMVYKIFKSYTEKDRELVRIHKQAISMARPEDLSFSPLPKDCYKILIEDVTECDEDMVIDTGFSLLGLFAGPVTYFIAQTAAFVKHSRCVDRAHIDYKRCMVPVLDPDPNTTVDGDGIIRILNPENLGDFIIFYP